MEFNKLDAASFFSIFMGLFWFGWGRGNDDSNEHTQRSALWCHKSISISEFNWQSERKLWDETKWNRANRFGDVHKMGMKMEMRIEREKNCVESTEIADIERSFWTFTTLFSIIIRFVKALTALLWFWYVMMPASFLYVCAPCSM